jgi:hypothetical protein
MAIHQNVNLSEHQHTPNHTAIAKGWRELGKKK